MEKKLFILAFTADNGVQVIHQKWMEMSVYGPKEMVRSMLSDYYTIAKSAIPDELVARAVVMPAVVKENFFVIHVVGDVDPALVGPFDTEWERDKAAGNVRANNMDDGVYQLDITPSGPLVNCYSGGELDQLASDALDRSKKVMTKALMVPS